MSSQRDGKISNFFQPKTKTTDNDETKDMRDPDRSDSSKGTNKPIAKHSNPPSKRPAPSPPSPNSQPTSKKPNTSKPPTHYSPADLPNNFSPKPDTTLSSQILTLKSHNGSIFDHAPPRALLVHACNTQGSWGAGIAKAFKEQYPRAFSIYRSFCTVTHNPKTNPVPVGTALLIAPVDQGQDHWIGCLFTSASYGKKKDAKGKILEATAPAMRMLLELVNVVGQERKGTSGEEKTEGVEVQDGDEGVGEVRMCKINSGLFGVEWERTEVVLRGVEVREGWKSEVHIWAPE